MSCSNIRSCHTLAIDRVTLASSDLTALGADLSAVKTPFSEEFLTSHMAPFHIQVPQSYLPFRSIKILLFQLEGTSEYLSLRRGQLGSSLRERATAAPRFHNCVLDSFVAPFHSRYINASVRQIPQKPAHDDRKKSLDDFFCRFN